jgi:[2Fe-2S] binding domain
MTAMMTTAATTARSGRRGGTSSTEGGCREGRREEIPGAALFAEKSTRLLVGEIGPARSLHDPAPFLRGGAAGLSRRGGKDSFEPGGCSMRSLTINGTKHEVDADEEMQQHVAQCGSCPSGRMMGATALLSAIPSPTHEQMEAAMAANLCRCGTFFRIR